MSGYNIFSKFYDSLTDNVEYKKRAEYFRTLLVRLGVKEGASILDLGCGTGRLTIELAKMGYDMIGVDISVDMLNEARNNSYNENVDILLLCQSMEELDLYGTVDCAVSSLDCINHLESEKSVQKAFANAGLFMNHGGVFVFDVNTKYKHREILGNNAFVYETNEVFCVWQNTLNKDDSVDISLDFFEENNGRYTRHSEDLTEKAYDIKDLKLWLEQADFEVVEVFDDMSLSPVKSDSQRAVITARYNGKREK